MAILSFLSAGLLFSLSMFESEYKRAMANREAAESETSSSSNDNAATNGSKAEKTD